MKREQGKRKEKWMHLRAIRFKDWNRMFRVFIVHSDSSNLQLDIDIHPGKLGNKEKEDAYRIEFLRIHSGLLKFFWEF